MEIESGKYNKARGMFDGARGFFDGLSGVAGSLAGTVSHLTDINDDIQESIRLHDDTQLNRRAAEQDLRLEQFKISRGDNLKIYGSIAAVALIGVVLIAR